MDIKLNKKFQALIPHLTPEEFEGLEKDIQKEGCRDPLVICDDTLIDGHNRYLICKKYNLPFKTINKEFKSDSDIIIWILDNALNRRNLSKFDKIKLTILKSEEIFKKRAKEKQIEAGREKLPQISVEALDTQKELAKLADTSHDTVSKVKFIEKYATPEQKTNLSEQKETINKVYQKLKQNEIKSNLKTRPLPKNKFQIILADPPWKYDFSNTNSREIENKYPTMELIDIQSLKIPSKDNAVLFLWATAPKLKEALEVMKSWGFEYKTHAIWNKINLGMGYWFRSQHELLLVGTKGKVSPPEQSLRVSSIFSEKRTLHSKKPELIYELIERLFPNSSYLELFARNEREKWTNWGNKIK